MENEINEQPFIQECQQLIQEGQWTKALVLLEQNMNSEPINFQSYYLKGSIFLLQGKQLKAIESFIESLNLHPNHLESLKKLAQSYFRLGNYEKAFKVYTKILSLEPQNSRTINQWLLCLRQVKLNFHLINDLNLLTLLSTLKHCFRDPDINKQYLQPICMFILKSTAFWTFYINNPNHQNLMKSHFFNRWMSHPLLNPLLKHVLITDISFEKLLIALRAQILCNIDNLTPEPSLLKFIGALAYQCFNNEFVYPLSFQEKQKLQHLSNSPLSVLIKALYEKLDAQDFNHQHENDNFIELRKQQIDNQELEMNYRKSLRSMTPIKDGTSSEVKAQYETNPYPRWFSFQRNDSLPFPQALSLILPDFTPPFFADEPPFQALIAGCGTGYHACLVASKYQNIEVSAMDLSATSLAYGQRKAQEYGLDNIQFFTGDILELSPRPLYHLIESVGVLHHLKEPLNGWTCLINCLKRGGIMKIGLYSSKGRHFVPLIRRYIQDNNLKPTPENIRELRIQLESHPHYNDILKSPDFYSLSGCRDLFFHVQETMFNLEEIDEFLDDSGLEFLGFEFENPIQINLYKKTYPNQPFNRLKNWASLEKQYPSIFASLYQFWCQKI